MARYHFSFFNRIEVRDPEGVELSGIEAARKLARESAAQIIADEIMEGSQICLSDHIVVTDADDAVVHTLHFAELIEQ